MGRVTAAPARMRALLGTRELIVAPFVTDALQARLAAATGFSAVYMTGFGTAAARGYPDLGLLTMTEMVDAARTIAAAVEVPVIADADTGYGNAVNVSRTIHEYAAAGAAAVHIEDQSWPKRCGFLAGKEVVPVAAMVAKVRAANEARAGTDLVLIGRTDALQPLGWDDAEQRARRYRDAGGDLVFVDGILTEADLDQYARRLADVPRVYNGALLPSADVAARGFAVQLHPGTMLSAFAHMRDVLAELKASGQIPGAFDPAVFADMLRVLGVPETLALAGKYAADE